MSLQEAPQFVIKLVYLLAPFGFVSILVLVIGIPWLTHKTDQGGIKGFCWMVFTLVLTILSGAWLGVISLALILWIVRLLLGFAIDWWNLFQSL